MDEDHLTNGRYNPAWFRLARQVIVFFLGIAILIYGVVSQGHDIPFLITGLILIGIIPVENALNSLSSRRATASHPTSE